MAWLDVPISDWQAQGAALLFMALLLAVGSYSLRKKHTEARSCRVAIFGGLCGAMAVVLGATLFLHFADTHRPLIGRLVAAEWIGWLIEVMIQFAPIIGTLIGVIAGLLIKNLRQKRGVSI